MKQVFRLEYDAVERELSITDNDFTTFEALGILEAAKAMINNDWLNGDEE